MGLLYMVDIQNVIAEAITASERLIHSITFMVNFDEFFFKSSLFFIVISLFYFAFTVILLIFLIASFLFNHDYNSLDLKK